MLPVTPNQHVLTSTHSHGRFGYSGHLAISNFSYDAVSNSPRRHNVKRCSYFPSQIPGFIGLLRLIERIFLELPSSYQGSRLIPLQSVNEISESVSWHLNFVLLDNPFQNNSKMLVRAFHIKALSINWKVREDIKRSEWQESKSLRFVYHTGTLEIYWLWNCYDCLYLKGDWIP